MIKKLTKYKADECSMRALQHPRKEKIMTSAPPAIKIYTPM